MLGAILGDIIGSVYEKRSSRTKNFPLFSPGCSLTDDSLMTIAVGLACVSSSKYDKEDFQDKVCKYMREIGNEFPDAGYGGGFYKWLENEKMGPYGSFGNGSAMRVSPVAYWADSLEEAEKLAKWSAEVTHDHPEGIRGAQAIAAAVYMARQGSDKDEIRKYIVERYYDLDFTLDEIRPTYSFDVSCQGSVPQAIECFLEATDYEDAIRNAISLSGDGDTLAAMAGAIAEVYFGIPDELCEKAFEYLNEDDRYSDWYFEYSDELYSR